MSEQDPVVETETNVIEYLSVFLYDIVSSPVNICLLLICVYLIYKIYQMSKEKEAVVIPRVEKPKLKKQNLTLEQLKNFDGKTSEHILIALNNKIYDVSNGATFYGPGGPYECLAGKDATRALGTFSFDGMKDDYDDISDLDAMDMERVTEWEMQFAGKYDIVGKLIRPGEPTEISESDEEEPSTVNTDNKVKSE